MENLEILTIGFVIGLLSGLVFAAWLGYVVFSAAFPKDDSWYLKRRRYPGGRK